MAKLTPICAEQDCGERTSRTDHPLCYTHWVEFKEGIIDECPNHPGICMPTEYDVCRQCHRENRKSVKMTPTIAEGREQYSSGGSGWEKPYSKPKANLLPAQAVTRVRKSMGKHGKECSNHESNTIQYLVEPMLRGLGWDFDDPEQVRKEFRPAEDPRPGKRGIAVDIALLEDGTPKVFVEAKRLDRNYDATYKEQINRYASYMQEGLAVLTNGRFWIVSPVRNGVTNEWDVIDISEGDPEEAAKNLQMAMRLSKPGPTIRKSDQTDIIRERLTHYRSTESKRRKKPPYSIFSNNTIKLLALQKPRSVRELERIKGIGPKNLEEHGAAILAIVNK